MWSRDLVLLMAAVVCAFLNYPALLVVGPVALGQAGAEASRAGLLTALFSGTTVATELSMPWLLARVPGKRVLVGALALMTLGSFASLPVVHSATGLLVLAPLRGVGFGATVVTIAVLAAELAPAARRAESLGYLGLASSIPNVIGPSLGLILAGVLGVEQCVPARQSGHPGGRGAGARHPAAAGRAGGRPASDPAHGLPRQLTVPFLALTLLATSYGGIVSYGALVLPSAGLASATLFFLVYGGARGLGRWLGGVSCPRFGVRNVTLAGLALAPGALLLLVLGVHDASPPLAGLVYGAGSGLAQSAILVGMLDRANSADVRLGSTMWNLALDLGVSLGGAGLALVAAGFGIDAVLWALPVLAGAGLAVYVFGLDGTPLAVLAGATALTLQTTRRALSSKRGRLPTGAGSQGRRSNRRSWSRPATRAASAVASAAEQAGARLDQHPGLDHRACAAELDAELDHLRKLAHHALDRAREQVHAAHHDHVVDATQDAVVQTSEGPPAGAGRGVEPDQVAGAIANQRRADAPQVGEHELARRRRRDRRAGARVDHLGDELGFDQVDAAPSRAREAGRAHLGHTGVVDAARPPCLLDSIADLRDAGARLAGVDEHPDVARAQVEAELGGALGESKRVGRRAADDGDAACRGSRAGAARWTCRRPGWSARRSRRPPRRPTRSR